MSPPRKDKKYNEMYELYKKGLNFTEIGKKFNTSGCCVKTGFIVRGFMITPRTKRLTQWYLGDKYTLRDHGYYQKTTGNRELLHRAVWHYCKGYIFTDCNIHHKDKDKSNNYIGNLEMINIEAHGKMHYKERILGGDGRFQ